jgi:predicted flavoprotein YhiN
MRTSDQIVVVGAGAGGLMAAGRAVESGAKVALFEKMEQPAKKLLLTGNGRCNFTNAKDVDEFVEMFGDNGRFLYAAFHQFFREELRELLEKFGIKSKVEEDGRIFPTTDRASDVLAGLLKYAGSPNIQMSYGLRIDAVVIEKRSVTGVKAGDGFIPTRAVILATGGNTYRATGSSGDGYGMATLLGHHVNRLRPALVPLVIKEQEIGRSLQGIGLHDIRLTGFACKKSNIRLQMMPNMDSGRGVGNRKANSPVLESRRGDLLFTHFGLSGPVTLLMSLAVVDALEQGPVSVAIDLFPDIAVNDLDRQLQREMDKEGRKLLRNVLGSRLPDKMAGVLLDMVGINPEKRGSQISAEERKRVTESLKCLRFEVNAALSLDAGMVTAGGIALDEVDPRTMQSKIVDGLFFCGEVLDLDAETGGFNLQAAFSTGYVAGQSAAKYVSGLR